MLNRNSFTALTLAALFLSAAPARCAEITVVSKAPYGALSDPSGPEAATVTFDQALVALTGAEKSGAACPLELFEVTALPEGYAGPAEAVFSEDLKKKAVKGRCRWRGTNTLAFEPAAPLKRASLYAARVRRGLRSEVTGAELAADEAWFFETARPALFQSAPSANQRWVPVGTVLFAAFTQPVSPGRAGDFVALTGAGPDGVPGQAKAAVRRAAPEEVKKLWPWYRSVSTATVLAVRPEGGLKPDHAYSLKFLKGLPGDEGLLGLPQDREVQFRTEKTFRLTVEPAESCLPAGYRLGFSNPVRPSEFLRSVKVEPPVEFKLPEEEEYFEANQYDSDENAYVYLPDIEYKPNTDYKFTVAGSLKDMFGNALGQNLELNVRTGDYCPRFKMGAGFGVLEGYLPPRHPADAVNAPPMPVVKGLVPPENFVPFYRGGMKDDRLFSKFVKRDWAPAAGLQNVKLRTFLDFSDLLGPDQGGFAFARVDRGGGLAVSALDNVTRLGLTFKTSPDSSFIWTTFLRTGRAAANMPVEIRDDENKVLWKGATDRNGFADAPGWLQLGVTDWKRWERPSLWLFAYQNSGAAVVNSSWNQGAEPWRFRLDYDNYPRPRRYAAAVFTERGVYRPGEAVNLKAVGRKLSGGDWDLLDIPVAQVTVTDARGVRVFKATVPVSAAFSSLDYTFTLPEGAATGVWTVEVAEPREDPKDAAAPAGEDGGEGGGYDDEERPFSFTESFRVEAFKPAVFEVKTRVLGEDVFAGDKLKAAVEGWYLFGAPMAGSRADWTVRLEQGRYEPPGHGDFFFGSYEGHGEFYGRQAGAGALELDKKGGGAFEVVIATNLPGSGAIAALVEAGVTDPERQRLFGRARAWVHRADAYFGVRASRGFLEAGKPWQAEIVTVRPGGEAALGLPVEAKLVKRQWLSSRRAGLGGRLEWVSETSDTVVSSSAFVSDGSTATWAYTPAEGGYYIFTVSGKDEQGRANSSSFSFYVLGGGDAWWAREDTDIAELSAEKGTYRPGETARILVKSPFADAQALVTVEREGVMDRWVATLKGGADFITVPIREKYLPNAFVSVMLIKGRAPEAKYSEDGENDLSRPQAKFGYVNLAVETGTRRLKVAVKSDAEKYRPGGTVQLEVRVTDERGRPAEAEAAVFAVDEGVLALTGYATPDLFSPFYGPRPLAVLTADTRPHIIGQRSYGEKGEARGGGGGAGLAGVDLRSKFVPTAYWNPSVVTDKNGYAKVTFTLPDNLTRFRLMAAAASGRRFGSGESALTVSKPLMLRPSLPRLARPGDKFDCGAVVQNYSETPIEAQLSLETAGDAVQAEGEALRKVAVEAGKAEEVAWKCAAAKTGETVFRFRAEAGGETDGLEWKLPVREAEPREYAALSGVTEARAEQAFRIPYKGAQGEIVFKLSPTALSGLEAGARFLLEYPYGCLEQKLSRAMPVITGAELVKEFGLGDLEPMKASVQKVLDRLGSYQHPAGGYCYWAGYCPQADPYLTSYALEAAALAAKEGYRPDEASLKKAARWLGAYLGSEKRDWAYPYSQSEDYAARAFAVYALALRKEPVLPYLAKLYERRSQLPYLAKGYLLKAARRAGFDKKATQRLAQEILSQAVQTPTLLHFEDPEAMPWVHNTPALTTAVMLDALLDAQGGFPGDEKAAQWLAQERKAAGRWHTTQENSAALRAFQNFYRRYEKTPPDFSGKVIVAGKVAASAHFKGRTLAAKSAAAAFSDLFAAGETAKAEFAKAGPGRLYYTARMSFVPLRRDKPAAEGFELTKEVKPLLGGGSFKAGERALVTLTVKTPQDRTFVAVNDPLPAGFEAVNTAFAAESAADAGEAARANARGGWWGEFERAEQYDDKVQIFADFLTKGTHKYSYVVQATTPGTYYGPSSLVEAMYEPEVFGRTAGSEVEISR